MATIANPVFYQETITGLSVTQAGWLPSTVYPTVGVYVQRGGQVLTLSSTQLSAGTVVQIPFSFTGLQAGDAVTAQEIALGSGCPFSELVAGLTAQYTVTLSANLSSLAAGAGRVERLHSGDPAGLRHLGPNSSEGRGCRRDSRRVTALDALPLCGQGAWFRCPAVGCGRRVAILVLPPWYLLAFIHRGSRSIKYCEQLSPVQKLNISLKTLRIMGQVLRNFPGVLKADLKLQLAQESYRVGLRTLRAILQLAERDIPGLRNYYAELLKERMALDDDDPKLLKSTDDLIVLLTRRLGFAMIKRVSHAVGLRELEETYQDVMKADGQLTSVRMIDLAIRLDHFTDFPKAEMERLIDLTSRNFYAFTLLRDMAANYLYLFPADHRTKQWVGTKLNINTNVIAYASKSAKKLES